MTTISELEENIGRPVGVDDVLLVQSCGDSDYFCPVLCHEVVSTRIETETPDKRAWGKRWLRSISTTVITTRLLTPYGPASGKVFNFRREDNYDCFEGIVKSEDRIDLRRG